MVKGWRGNLPKEEAQVGSVCPRKGTRGCFLRSVKANVSVSKIRKEHQIESDVDGRYEGSFGIFFNEMKKLSEFNNLNQPHLPFSLIHHATKFITIAQQA